ncbi:MAG: transglutaminase domain-containing protein [Woeseiaceae bacterium]|nr:transglutaminase domain-containing protein [Woeseiaceae bacterium]
MARLNRPAHCRPRVALLLCSAWVAAAAAEPGSTYLFSIPVVPPDPGSATAGDMARVTLTVTDPGRAAAVIERGGASQVVARGVDSITVRQGLRPTLGGASLPQHRAASFVVDFDEAPIGAVMEQLEAAVGPQPDPAALARFVAAFIDDKSYLRDFDTASRVARSRTGDCTEHAVLLAALARAAGWPARIVLGVLILDGDAGLAAFGHAWTEIHAAAGWEVVDATLPEADPAVRRARYLPLISLDDEGPGYGLDLLRLAPAHPARIAIAPAGGP